MTILNFKEIPEAHLGGGEQDRFELLARDFFEYLGYRTNIGPSRGADGGKDLVIEEVRTGISGQTKIKWLVSCKHLAHSGKSVTPSIENNIADRVQSNGCKGFIVKCAPVPGQ